MVPDIIRSSSLCSLSSQSNQIRKQVGYSDTIVTLPTSHQISTSYATHTKSVVVAAGYLAPDKQLIGQPALQHPLTLPMADDEDQDVFDSLEREASEFTKVSISKALQLSRSPTDSQSRMRRSIAFARHSRWMRKSPQPPLLCN